MKTSVTLSQLESHLWKAAWLLKGPVDAADFKTYIFPLLFFKRLSDVHDEEHAVALQAFDGDEEAALFPENYRFQVPEGCHWQEVRTVAVNVGQALQTALRGIEQANPHTLYGTFGDAQWTKKDRLREKLLRDLHPDLRADTATPASAKPKPRSHSAGLLRSERQLLATVKRDSANIKAKPFRRACRTQDNPRPFNNSDTALRGNAFLQSEAKPQVVSETNDNFRKDDNVRWQWSGATWTTRQGCPEGERRGVYRLGVPPKGNANFAWVQHFIHHLAFAFYIGGRQTLN